MPVTPTYPGVYVEEIPSGVRTITGVATSITAFLGRAAKGPSEPTTINSFADFERQFGGLGSDYPMSYAVRDFYLNGGSQAIIVRVFKVTAPADGKAHLVIDSNLRLAAASPGEWGKKLRATVDVEVPDEVRTRVGVAAGDALFNLTVRDSSPGGATEQFRNLTVVDSSRRVDRVLEAESNLVRWDGAYPAPPPALTKVLDAGSKWKDLLAALKTGDKTKIDPARTAYEATKKDLDDAATTAEKALAAALAAPIPVPADITKAQTDLDNAEKATKAGKSEDLLPADIVGKRSEKSGMFALEKADLFNLLLIPPDKRDGDTDPSVYQAAMAYCVERRAMLIVDSPAVWSKNKDTAAATAKNGLDGLGLSGDFARNAALYFPRVQESDPLREGQVDTFVPCGIIAGVMARTDTSRGVWKAPAGMDAGLNGIQALQVNLNDPENGILNPLGINCLRSFPVTGRVVWGARTLRGADQLADEYKYVPVRRLALYLEESLYRGLKWVVFEPNDEPLWAQIRLNVGAFMQDLFRQGAFQGKSPREAYFVKCDKETTIQNDINKGVVNILVGFAPLKPAEFVIIKIQQIAGQIQV